MELFCVFYKYFVPSGTWAINKNHYISLIVVNIGIKTLGNENLIKYFVPDGTGRINKNHYISMIMENIGSKTIYNENLIKYFVPSGTWINKKSLLTL